jgi:hypothetical protein
MTRQYKFVRMQELRTMLATIENAVTCAELSKLYILHIGYDIFEDDPSLEFDDVQSNLVDFVKEVSTSEGFRWPELLDIETR